MSLSDNFRQTVRRFRLKAQLFRRSVDAESRALPDYVIIGAQKSGTTSMYRYLKKHPQIKPAYEKSIQFFDFNFDKGIDWYRSYFPRKDEMVHVDRGWYYQTGESSPYYFFHPLVPERMAQVLPDAKLILMLRNPVDRAYSHYQHVRRNEREDLSFADAIEAEAGRLDGVVEKIRTDPDYSIMHHRYHSYVSRGRYIDQFRNWLKYFPLEQFLILKSEDFFQDEEASLRKITDYLEIEPVQLKSYPNANPGRYTPMDDGIREKLTAYFEPYNQQLYELTGIDFDWH